MDCDERIQLDLDVDAHATCVGPGERVSLAAFHLVILTEIAFEDVDFDQCLPNVGQRQGYHRRRSYARIR